MIDVVVIGGGSAGLAIATSASKAGLQVVVVDESLKSPEAGENEWVEGHASLYGSGLVAVLDPQTGDERRLLQSRAVVLSIGTAVQGNPAGKMLGISKLGINFGNQSRTIKTNSRGETSVPGIFATGSCSSSPTPVLLEALLQYCSVSHSGKIS